MLKILHISDLHFQVETEAGKKATTTLIFIEFLKYLSEISEEKKFDYIFITGDKGCGKSYIVANEQISKLLENLGVDKGRVFICPGNHDLIREKLKNIATPKTKKNADDILKVENFDKLLPIFENYTSFCEDMGFCKFAIGTSENYLVGHTQTDDLNVVCLNTAWLAKKKNSELWIGKNFVDIIELHKHEINSDLMTITIFHHPVDLWHESEKRNYHGNKSVYTSIKEFSDMVLIGHTHESTSSPSWDENGAFICAAGAGDDKNESHNFKVYEVDEKEKIVKKVVEHRHDTHDWHEAESWLNPFCDSKSSDNSNLEVEGKETLLNSYYECIRRKFEKEPTALGKGYSLKDIYIKPYIKNKNISAADYVEEWMAANKSSKVMLLLGVVVQMRSDSYLLQKEGFSVLMGKKTTPSTGHNAHGESL